ncbi:MAG: DinB family protein [Pirellulaceae bacterium]|nr:DinB family protein [Pirellulaceae bacterium]
MPTTPFSPPTPGDYGEFYETYVSRFQPQDFLNAFAQQADTLVDLMGDLPPGEDSRLHPPYTWTLKQLMGHLIDCERIFGTRVLRIAVNDPTPNPGMEHISYVENLDYEAVSMSELLAEFGNLRRANVLLAKRLTSASLANVGTASDYPVSANANLFIMGGHVAYHLEIIRQRLGQQS